MRVIYIPTEKYKYIVITESDTILQEYYITRKYQSTIHEIYIIKAERCSRYSKRDLESQSGEELEGKSYGGNTSFCCATLIATEGSAMLHALKSEHTGRGLSDTTQRVQEMRPSGVHIRHTCT